MSKTLKRGRGESMRPFPHLLGLRTGGVWEPANLSYNETQMSPSSQPWAYRARHSSARKDKNSSPNIHRKHAWTLGFSPIKTCKGT